MSQTNTKFEEKGEMGGRMVDWHSIPIVIVCWFGWVFGCRRPNPDERAIESRAKVYTHMMNAGNEKEEIHALLAHCTLMASLMSD